MRRVMEEQSKKKYEMQELIREHEHVLTNHDKIAMQRILDQERKNMMKRAEERLLILEREAMVHQNEMDKYRKSLKLATLNQQKYEFEAKMKEIRRENELKVLEEEKKLQDILLGIEEEKKL